jgi:hypothetical protein
MARGGARNNRSDARRLSSGGFARPPVSPSRAHGPLAMIMAMTEFSQPSHEGLPIPFGG